MVQLMVTIEKTEIVQYEEHMCVIDRIQCDIMPKPSTIP